MATLPHATETRCQPNERLQPHHTNSITQTYGPTLNRKFSGDESFLKDPNAFNDAKNTTAVEVVDAGIGAESEKAEDKSRL